MGLYSSSNADLTLRDDLRTNIGQPSQADGLGAAATDRGLIGILKGVWQTLLDRLPVLSAGAIPVTSSGVTASSVTVATFAVTTTTAILLPANAQRLRIILFNPLNSAGSSFINFGAAATTTDGMIIPPGYEREIDIPFTGAIHVIGSAAHSLIVREVLR